MSVLSKRVLRLEGRVDLQETVIDGLLVGIEQHLDNAKSLQQRAEQRAISLFRLPQRLRRTLARGDGACVPVACSWAHQRDGQRVVAAHGLVAEDRVGQLDGTAAI